MKTKRKLAVVTLQCVRPFVCRNGQVAGDTVDAPNDIGDWCDGCHSLKVKEYTVVGEAPVQSGSAQESVG